MQTATLSGSVIILMVLLVAFGAGVVIRLLRRYSSATGWFLLFCLMMAGLLFFGIFTVRISMPQPVEIVTPMPQTRIMQTTVTVEPESAKQPASAKATESIEEMWKQLTAPRINLDESTVVDEAIEAVDEPAGPRSPQELTQAAKVILSASVPGADPFTQGWLVSAAKSILAGQAPQAPEAPAAPAAAAQYVMQAEVDPVIEIDGKLAVQGRPLPAKPDWVVTPPKQVGNVRKVVVTSGPFSTVDECQRFLDMQMRDAVWNRMAYLSGSSLTRRSGPAELGDMGLGGDYIRRELCTDEFVDTLDSSVGEMKQAYALLEFNESQDAMLVDRARSYSRQQGLQGVSIIGGGLLASVAALFGLLKVDTWTRGYYTKRLFLGVPAAIITVLALLLAGVS